MNKSNVMLVLVVCLALLSQEAYPWRPRSFYPRRPVGPAVGSACQAATNYDAMKACRDEEAEEFASFSNGKLSGHLGWGPACCAFRKGVFDSCVRPNLPAELKNGTDYPWNIRALCN